MANLYLSTPSMLIPTNVKSPDWPEQKGKIDPFPTKRSHSISKNQPFNKNVPFYVYQPLVC